MCKTFVQLACFYPALAAAVLLLSISDRAARAQETARGGTANDPSDVTTDPNAAQGAVVEKEGTQNFGRSRNNPDVGPGGMFGGRASARPNKEAVHIGGQPDSWLPFGGAPNAAAKIPGRSAVVPEASSSGQGYRTFATPNRWRYRWHQGRWWYYTNNGSWDYWSGSDWLPYSGTARNRLPVNR